MDHSLKRLPDASGTQWEALGIAVRSGLPVPGGFIVLPSTPEELTRAAYEELKISEKTHFLAVRARSHAALNIIGSDALINAVRRFGAEAAEAPVLVQRMIHSMWCGKAQWHRKNLR